VGGWERRCLRKHKRLSRSDHKKEIKKINILFVVVVVLSLGDFVENLKKPFTACILPFCKNNFFHGKALGFLLANCGNLLEILFFDPLKFHFSSEKRIFEFSTFFSTFFF
jgi:hypothetical protein